MSKQSELNAAYRAVRSNYLRNIRSMERRGYVFERGMRPSIPKRITEGSIRRLQRLNEGRYSHAYLVDPNTGEVLAKGKRAQGLERSLASQRAAQTRRANRAREEIEQFAGAMGYETEQADPEGSTARFFGQQMDIIKDISERSRYDDQYAIERAAMLNEKWQDIQQALEYIANYGSIEQAPDRLVHWLIVAIRDLQGEPVTQEDMIAAGMFSEDADYYP